MLKPTITPHQLNIFVEPVSDIYRALELNLFELMVKRLKTSADYSSDNVLQWQVERLNELRMLNRETIQTLSQATGVAEKEIIALVNDIGYRSINSVDNVLQGNMNMLAIPTDLDMRLESFINQTFRELDNYVNQTLITTNFGRGTVEQTYRKIVEETTAKVLAGQMTIKDAVSETVLKWSKAGIESSFVDKGGNIWKTPHYAETVVRNTVNRTYNDVRLSRMDEYDVEFALMSSLPDARPACSHIQGRVVSMQPVSSDPQYPSIYDYGYGEPDGTRGIGCRHILYPYIPGVNFNNEEQYNEETVSENYKRLQTQRRLEREIRDAKGQEHLSKLLGDDKQVEKYRQQVKHRQAKMRKYTAEHNLPRRYERERLMIK